MHSPGQFRDLVGQHHPHAVNTGGAAEIDRRIDDVWTLHVDRLEHPALRDIRCRHHLQAVRNVGQLERGIRGDACTGAAPHHHRHRLDRSDRDANAARVLGRRLTRRFEVDRPADDRPRTEDETQVGDVESIDDEGLVRKLLAGAKRAGAAAPAARYGPKGVSTGWHVVELELPIRFGAGAEHRSRNTSVRVEMDPKDHREDRRPRPARASPACRVVACHRRRTKVPLNLAVRTNWTLKSTPRDSVLRPTLTAVAWARPVN